MRIDVAALVALVTASGSDASGEGVREALLALRESRWNSRDIAGQYAAADVYEAAIALAAEHPDFELGDPARIALVETLVMVAKREGRGVFESRGDLGDFALSELRNASAPSRVMLLSEAAARPGSYRADICTVIADEVADLGKVEDVAVLWQSLRTFANIGAARPELVDPLRALVLHGDGMLHPELAERDKAGVRLGLQIRSVAASALIVAEGDVRKATGWFVALDDPAQLLAAREALGIGLAPDGQFDRLDEEGRRVWVDGLLALTRSTLDERGVRGDETVLFISLGERYPAFRQDVGDLFEELLVRGVREAASSRAMKSTLERWSTAP